MANQNQADELNYFLKANSGANEYFLSLPGFVRDKLKSCGNQIKSEKDFYELAENFQKEET